MRGVPTVSVLMPVYNAERYVAEAVESILSQAFSDFEFLIIDDGSTDRSLEILERFAMADERIKLGSRPNTGIVGALNEMLALARGEFIARMDADDIAMPMRFQRQVAFLRTHPHVTVVGTRVLLIDPDGEPLCEMCTETDHEKIDASHLNGAGHQISHPAAMIRAAALREVGGYDPSREPAEDLHLWLKLAERSRLANLPDVLLRYRQHPLSTGYTRHAAQHEIQEAIVREARARRGRQPLPARSKMMKATNPTENNLKWGWWALRAGNLRSARKHALLTLRSRPVSLESWRLAICAVRGR